MSLVRVDCHLHTVASGDAVTTLDELAERAVRAGLDVVCVTDPNETSAAVTAAGRDLGVRIVVGEEIRTPDGDIIGLFLSERVPYVLPVADVATADRDPAGIVEIAGPREEDLGQLAALLATRRGAPVKVQVVRDPADPDADVQATGGLLPGPGARLAGPTFEEWLDQQ